MLYYSEYVTGTREDIIYSGIWVWSQMSLVAFTVRTSR